VPKPREMLRVSGLVGSRLPGRAAKERRRWLPWAAVGLLVLALYLGVLPLREWIEALQSWLLGLGLWRSRRSAVIRIARSLSVRSSRCIMSNMIHKRRDGAPWLRQGAMIDFIVNNGGAGMTYLCPRAARPIVPSPFCLVFGPPASVCDLDAVSRHWRFIKRSRI
jgi:hypothetical protein